MISPEDVIAELAKEQNLLIGRDDPILKFLAVHQKMIDLYAEKIGNVLEESQQQFSAQLIDAQDKYNQQSRKIAYEIVGEAVTRINDAEERLEKRLEACQVSENTSLKNQLVLLKTLLWTVLIVTAGHLLWTFLR